MLSQNLKASGISLILAVIPIVILSAGFLPLYSRHTSFYEVLFLSPYVLTGLVALLGFRLNSTRIFFVSISFLLAYALLTSTAVNRIVWLPHASRAAVATFALPVSLIVVFALREGRLLSREGLTKALAVISPFFLVILGLRLNLGFVQSVLQWRFLPYPEIWRISDTSHLAFLAFGVSAILFRNRYIQYFSISCVIGLIPLVYGFNAVSMSAISRLLVNITGALTFSGASLVLLYAIYRIYWQKVYIDELTGVPNRRALDERLLKLGKTFSIAIIDIDHFKRFNDTYGHDQGDDVLRRVATHFDRESRHRIYRYGGEEFCLLYDKDRADDVSGEVNRIRKSLADRDFYITSETARKRTSWLDRGRKAPSGTKVQITVSIGLADSRPNARKTPAEVIRDADQALYQAKRGGRNRVAVSQ